MAEEIRYPQAVTLLREAGLARSSPTTQVVELAQALGRVLAEDMDATELVPPYRNSAVDGFALRAEWTRELSSRAPGRFAVRAQIIAGDTPSALDPRHLTACSIMTGAPFPEGLDASVKIEEVSLTRDAQGTVIEITLDRPVEPGENVRDAGEDFKPGDPLLRAGDRIGPEQLIAAATLGHATLPVQRRPRAVVISTGREIVDVRQQPRPGQIRNSTAPFLLAALSELGFETTFGGAVGDDPNEFLQALARARKGVDGHPPDIIVTTGAVSMGVHDYVAEAVAQLGARILFHRVSIRPGKPILVAELGPTVVFGLPGNPVSTVVGTRFFIEPFLRALQRREIEAPIRAQLTQESYKPSGLRCFFKARIVASEGDDLMVRILPGQPSFMVHPLLESNAWAVLEEDGHHVTAGQWIDVYPLYSQTHPWTSRPLRRSPDLKERCC